MRCGHTDPNCVQNLVCVSVAARVVKDGDKGYYVVSSIQGVDVGTVGPLALEVAQNVAGDSVRSMTVRLNTLVQELVFSGRTHSTDVEL